MEDINCPLFTVEHFGTYCSALWMYEEGGVDDSFVTQNDGEEWARFICEKDARDYFKRNHFYKLCIDDACDYPSDDPEVNIEYWMIVRYDNWDEYYDGTGVVIEKSKGCFTSRQMQNLFKKMSGTDLKELSKRNAAGQSD